MWGPFTKKQRLKISRPSPFKKQSQTNYARAHVTSCKKDTPIRVRISALWDFSHPVCQKMPFNGKIMAKIWFMFLRPNLVMVGSAYGPEGRGNIAIIGAICPVN